MEESKLSCKSKDEIEVVNTADRDMWTYTLNDMNGVWEPWP
jgi:hypothetical protein